MSELSHGRRLRAIHGVPDQRGERLTIRAGYGRISHRDADEIVVVMEQGSAGLVPWARVQWPNGRVELVNLATVESVVLDGPELTPGFERKGSADGEF
jgi:hypothetical protein